MKFKVTILGSGSAVPTRDRNPTAQLINLHNTYILADCAEGTQLCLRENSIRLQKVDYILISHLHGDHFYGLPGLISTLHLLGRSKPITIFGPPGLEKAVMGMVEISRSNLRYPLRFVETQTEHKELIIEHSTFEIYSFPLLHKVPTTGFLFEEKPKKRLYRPEIGEDFGIPHYWIDRIKQGQDYIDEEGNRILNRLLTKDPEPPKSYAFCTDTAYYPKIATFIQDVDVIYHEASFLVEDKKRALETRHSTSQDAAQIAMLCNARKLVIGHFSARYNNLQPFLEEAKPFFNNVVLAYDGMVINV
ncbi:ribonuclease Z [Luteibaculum oceani]|uniref:ribonuclease Z n=1 Tax=Luteibaculum oceani TaxID=1294296 RepID=UPI001476BA25|nr:ribonuclease Z [Luteibaculum oceani]